jgi:hypothetical protein|tara:strand:- start:467 stop:613 length:147 start_codon:yes stop_codon:yes gene_type:complete
MLGIANYVGNKYYSNFTINIGGHDKKISTPKLIYKIDVTGVLFCCALL